MAAAGGKKKKGNKKGTTLNLNEFLADKSSSPAPPPISWADEMENEMVFDEEMDVSKLKLNIDRSILPSAPRAARGPDVDMARVPDSPPFTAFLGNLPYDIDEDDIAKFFRDLECVNIRLPSDGGRMKGFGYAEFPTKAALLEALAMNEGQLRNRKIRIDLAGSSQGGEERGGFGSGGRRDDDGEDRTAGDWRRAPRTDDEPRGGDRGGDRYNDRDKGYGGSGGSSWGRDRDSRSGGYGDRDRGSSFGGDRDRQGGGGGYGDRDGGRRQFGSGYSGGRDSRDGPRDGPRQGSYGGSRGYSPPRDRYGGGSGSGGGGYERKDSSPPRERPRLALQPRSKPADGESNTQQQSSIFGDAKPIDTAKYEDKSREERLKDHDAPPPPRSRAPPPSQQESAGDDSRRPLHPADQADHHEMSQRPERSSGPPGERPRLNLQKRTKPVEEAGKTTSTSSIFGQAKPVDTTARERLIEERLQRERQRELEEIEQEKEKRLSQSSDPRASRSSTSTRRDSQNSDESGEHGAGGRRDSKHSRTRKLSSSSSGKGIRTVAPPPGVGSARVRRESTVSDGEPEVFDESPKSPPVRQLSKEENPPKMVPAPPPKENIWAKRKEAMVSPPKKEESAPIAAPARESAPAASSGSAPHSPPVAAASSPPASKPASVTAESPPPAAGKPQPPAPAVLAPQQQHHDKGKENLVPAPPPATNAWSRKPNIATTTTTGTSSAAPPPARDSKPRSPACDVQPKPAPAAAAGRPELPADNPWSRGKPGGGGGGGRGASPSGGAGGRGRGERPTTRKPDKPLPQSIDEMPKADDLEGPKAVVVDSNKFAMLQDDDDNNDGNKSSD